MIRTNDDSKGTTTILVVEDEKEIRGLAVEFLESLVYEVLEAGDGPSALDVLEKKGKGIRSRRRRPGGRSSTTTWAVSFQPALPR